MGQSEIVQVPSSAEIAEAFKRRLVAGLVISNIDRGRVVEIMVHLALGGGYRLTEDWIGWDLEGANPAPGELRPYRIEVKQTAANQSWHDRDKNGEHSAAPKTKYAAIFDIKCRQGEYDKAGKLVKPYPTPSRPADLYVFAFHTRTDATCDQWDPHQWRFHVVPTAELNRAYGTQKSVGLAALQRRLELGTDGIAWSELADACQRLLPRRNA